jgi:hypothetical protein
MQHVRVEIWQINVVVQVISLKTVKKRLKQGKKVVSKAAVTLKTIRSVPLKLAKKEVRIAMVADGNLTTPN